MSEIKGFCENCRFSYCGGLAPWDYDGGCAKEDELAEMEDNEQIEDISMVGQPDGEACPLWELFEYQEVTCEKHNVTHSCEDPCPECEREENERLDAAMADWQALREETCRHGIKGDCDKCNIESDFAYDAARESYRPKFRD